MIKSGVLIEMIAGINRESTIQVRTNIIVVVEFGHGSETYRREACKFRAKTRNKRVSRFDWKFGGHGTSNYACFSLDHKRCGVRVSCEEKERNTGYTNRIP